MTVQEPMIRTGMVEVQFGGRTPSESLRAAADFLEDPNWSRPMILEGGAVALDEDGVPFLSLSFAEETQAAGPRRMS